MAQYYVVMWSLVMEIMVLLVIRGMLQDSLLPLVMHSMLEDSQVHLQTWTLEWM